VLFEMIGRQPADRIPGDDRHRYAHSLQEFLHAGSSDLRHFDH
jgi:hypothetical protein